MFRSRELKILFGSQSPIKSIRALSAKPAEKASKTSFQEEWDNAKPYPSIPSMGYIGTIRSFLPGGKFYKAQLLDVHRILKKEFGNICKFPGMFGRPEMLMTFNPEDSEKLFRFEGQFPFRRTLETLDHYRKNVRPDIYGEFGSLLSEQDEQWYKMRMLVNPVMMKPATVKLYIPQVEAVTNDFIKMIMDKRDSKNEVPANFSDYVNMWSLESITCISLSVRLGILNANYHDENAEKLIKLIRKFFEMTFDFEVNPSIWRYYETKAFKELLTVYDGMTNIILEYIEKAVKDKGLNHTTEEDREGSILEKLLKINKKVAVVMCADAMLAGVDTTSSAAIGILYCLAKNQEKQDKLREELTQILPNKDDPLTPEKMRSMPYLRAVIKEGIRFYPPAIGNLRRANEDLVLSGYQVPKGTEVAMGAVMTHMDEKQFKRPTEFIPERWMKSNTDASCPHSKDAHPFAYMPFGFGARMCIGRRFAELEIEAFLIRLVRNYKIEWHHPDMKIKSVMVNIPDGDLKFRFTEV